jgi:hypothetical protein
MESDYSSSLPNSIAWYFLAFLLGFASEAPFGRGAFSAQRLSNVITRKSYCDVLGIVFGSGVEEVLRLLFASISSEDASCASSNLILS